MVVAPSRSFTLGNLDAAGLLFFPQYLTRQWLHVPRQFSVVVGRVFNIFFVKGSSVPVVDSRPALVGCSMEKYAQSRLRLDCARSLHLESGHYFHEPLVSDSHVDAVSGLQEKS